MEKKEKYWIVVLPGDGAGREVSREAVKVLEAVAEKGGFSFDIEKIPCGGEYYLEHGLEWPVGSFEKCKNADAIFLGAVGHFVDGKEVYTKPGQPYEVPQLAGYAQVIENRQKLNLFANVRPLKLYSNVPQRFGSTLTKLFDPEKVDYVIVRENTEGEYSGRTYPITDSKGIEIGKYTPINITEEATERIVRFAFELAEKRDGKKKVTCVEKSNIIGAHRFFRDVFSKIHKREFSHLEADYAYFDAFCQSQMRTPEAYDVVVAPNLVGDVISDNGSTTIGGLGFAAGGNIGEDHAMFEPIHGSAPQIAGQDKVNPIAAILSMKMLLEWLGDRHSDEDLTNGGAKVEEAVRLVLEAGAPRTEDMGGQATCSAMGDAIADKVREIF